MTLVRRAAPPDAERLREVMAAAKAYWDYDPDLVADWAAGADFSEQRFSAREVYVAEEDGALVAWYALAPVGVLDDLWVEPASIGTGIGRLLFEHACARARELGWTTLEWEAEPKAVPFYEHMGARVVGETIGTWGRPLPVMRLELT